MESHTKNYLSYLIALSVFFSYVEACFPHPVPFLRLGFANIVVLSSFSLSFGCFSILIIFRSFISSLISGTLFSPFVLLSLSQSVVSGYTMYFFQILNKKIFKSKAFSIYGLSVLGSSLSSIVQLYVASLFLGKNVFLLFPYMLIFSIFSGIITAYLSSLISIRAKEPELSIINQDYELKKEDKYISFINIILLFLCMILSMLVDNIYYLLVILILSFLLQLTSGRKLKLFIHFFLFVFIVLTSLLSPIGEVFYQIGKFKITKQALLNGIVKSFKLSILMALSLAVYKIKFSEESFIFKIQAYLYALIAQKNKIKEKWPKNIILAIRSDSLECEFKDIKKSKEVLYYLLVCIIILLSLIFILLKKYNFFGAPHSHLL